jgi:7-cyano-7-deazaguanine synthase
MRKQSALVVLSGGQDSTTCLYWAIEKYGKENVHAVTFDYGQRHSIEIEAAEFIADMAGIAGHETIDVRGILQSTSPLTSTNQLDKYENFQQMEAAVGNNIEKTFVPMRNTLFLTIAMNRAIAIGAQVVVTGICQEDNANYPDCTENFRRKLEAAFDESLRGDRAELPRFEIETPLMYLSKAATVYLANELPGCMDALARSHTSYDGKFPPTDNNHSNLLRAHGFCEAHVPDPLVLRAWAEGLMDLPPTINYRDEALQEFFAKHRSDFFKNIEYKLYGE